ncbi:cytochrome c-type biogenesis protein [Rickettsiella grylli]|uniref:Cytochrome c-type biogenesis protein n=1 Tax=Rickettsiella grylli TaxID=59196 RepID=A8PLF8_9COXI|nr:cytochrome c-type biogenesis protein [Rickettsiella grylli]EDP45864.1 cytochrome c-type biogenesis protein CcmH [Rickettsiella grylli]
MLQEIVKKIGLSRLFYIFILFPSYVFSEVSETYSFSSLQQETQFETILHEMRCLVCQNQSLADSNAPLANDLRRLIYQHLQEGKSAHQIKKYLVSRYGEFISFKPFFSCKNMGLWLSPFILLVISLLWILYVIKRNVL